MNTPVPVSFQNARSMSLWIERFSTVIVLALPVAVALGGACLVFLYDDLYVKFQLRGFPKDASPILSVSQRLLLVGLFVLYIAPVWMAARYVRRLFRSFSRNEVFTAQNVTRLRAIGAWLLVSVISANVVQGLFIVITRPPDPEFDLSLVPAIYAAMVYVIAYVLEEANRIAEENRKFV